MIDQPELGQKLLALRKEKGITQQELRERCHVSVRTIQRIESGAVIPRVSTIRILAAALDDSDAAWLRSDSGGFSPGSIFLYKSSEKTIMKALLPGAIAGIVLVLMNMIDLGIDLYIEETDASIVATVVTVKVLLLLSFFFFTRGFLALALLFENQLLKVGSYLYIIVVSFGLLAEIIILSFFPTYESVLGGVNFVSLIGIGAIAVIFGMGLLRLQDSMGRISKVAGRMEIVYGISFLSLIFSFVGVLLLYPLLIIEIVLLFKADNIIRNEPA